MCTTEASGLIIEQLICIEVGHLKVRLESVEESEGCEVEGFHVSCVECPLIIGTEGAACGCGLCHFANWLSALGGSTDVLPAAASGGQHNISGEGQELQLLGCSLHHTDLSEDAILFAYH